MAHEFVTWAYKQDLPMAMKFVLVALSDRANHDGYCWPSMQNLADMTGQSKRSVVNQIGQLVEKGFIKKHERRRDDGYKASNGYEILSERASRENISGERGSGETHDISQVKEVPIKEPSLEPSIKNNPTDYKNPPQKNDGEKKKPKRATRIPDDWFVSLELGEWAMGNGLARGEVVQVEEQFVDHWKAASGKGSTALDWDAKFRTWVRNEIKWRK